MAEQKKNKDGLVPGSLVDAKTVAKVNAAKRRAKLNAK